MSVWFWLGLIFVCSLLAAIVGTAAGMAGEARAWLSRAETKGCPHQTAHFCDGKFYYVIEESHFHREYRRRNHHERKEE